ncbi:MAG: hypothetical protein CVV30_01510 [Methanomicrobiales archaeon HGW-Methanomicrobiales-1]|jgi:hypothetical protein|nr:MAG: hypothetical protein CVV30_01510 [Methanomicrobiales archaeon HGW-Methanomicrobiales-1]
MKSIFFRNSVIAIILVFIVILVIPTVNADGYIPTKTTVYLEQDGKPVTGPFSWNVSCYGYMCKDYACRPDPAYGERDFPNAAMVFSYFASCPQYGCVIYQPFYLNHRHITWCDMAGTVNGTPFALPNFSANPLPDCTYDLQFDAIVNDTYYRYPAEYHSCLKVKEQMKKEVCGKYITPVTWAEIENSTGQSWFANNGTYWIRTNAYFTCISQMEKEGRDCGTDHPLQPVDPSILKKDPQGNLIGNFCSIRIALPSTAPGNNSLGFAPAEDTQPSVFIDGDRGLPLPDRSPVESLYCGILNLIGVSC